MKKEIYNFCKKLHATSECKYTDDLSFDDKKRVLLKKLVLNI